MGGGGRGMRVVEDADKFDDALEQARREALASFGCADAFIEKFVRKAKHIEVQLLGDQHGGLVHLYERDCSIQRRHQKVIEIAPGYNLDPALRDAICDAAIKIGRAVGYRNAGTVEFLVDDETGTFYFIEVNPRLQVEHTVTEIVTGIDLVKSQILIAQGRAAVEPGHRHRRSVVGPHPGVRDPVPDHDRGPDQQLHARLRPDHPLSVVRRAGAAARRRLDHLGGDHHAVLRLAPGEGLGLRPAVRGRGFEDGTGAPGIPDSGGQNQHPVPLERDHQPRVPVGALHDPVHRLDARAVPVRGPSRPGDEALGVHGRRGGQRLPGHEARPVSGAPDRAADPPLQPRRADPRRLPAAVQGDGPRGVLEVGARPEAAAGDRHHVPRRPPVAVGHPAADPRHAPGRRGLRAPAAPTCSRSRCGAGRRSTRRCGSSRKTRGSGWLPSASSIPNILFQMLFRGLERRRLHELPGQRRDRVRQGVDRRRHRPVPGLRLAELGPQHGERH